MGSIISIVFASFVAMALFVFFLLSVSKVHQVFVGLDVAKITSAQAASHDLQSVHTDLTIN